MPLTHSKSSPSFGLVQWGSVFQIIKKYNVSPKSWFIWYFATSSWQHVRMHFWRKKWSFSVCNKNIALHAKPPLQIRMWFIFQKLIMLSVQKRSQNNLLKRAHWNDKLKKYYIKMFPILDFSAGFHRAKLSNPNADCAAYCFLLLMG